MAEALGWGPHLGGSTLGMAGSMDGIISRDESLAEGRGRLTLEEDAARGFFALTCSVEGWLVHTRYFGSREEALAAFEEMKPALAHLVAALPLTPGDREQVARAGPLLGAFTARFP
jgi:hypothetical protein